MKGFEKCDLYNVEYKCHSYYGNPCYWISFSDSDGHYHRGYTASNSSAGYTASNYKYCYKKQYIYLKYHFTKKGSCVIDFIKHDDPSAAMLEAEQERN